MGEGIVLEPAPRGFLLHEIVRVARLEAAAPQIMSAIEWETDPIVIQTTLAALLYQVFVQASWVGFYRRTGPARLSVGPYQGPMGCLHIPFDRGVCGAAAREKKTQLVPDVHAFHGHIACDDGTRSELVVPIVDVHGKVHAVLDLDSHLPDAFSVEEAHLLERFLVDAFGAAAWP